MKYWRLRPRWRQKTEAFCRSFCKMRRMGQFCWWPLEGKRAERELILWLFMKTFYFTISAIFSACCTHVKRVMHTCIDHEIFAIWKSWPANQILSKAICYFCSIVYMEFVEFLNGRNSRPARAFGCSRAPHLIMNKRTTTSLLLSNRQHGLFSFSVKRIPIVLQVIWPDVFTPFSCVQKLGLKYSFQIDHVFENCIATTHVWVCVYFSSQIKY